ncbi:phosphopantetheine-binding protein [Wenjunlia tyrosinilytica]|uniref:Actinorhodin polyketide synthase acyl carrier protein n=1 Tax=Wenjunlia tyrosinilytica TaxID=1544741 RepID=A0A917ZW36_9ACTN|nr:phosphopantetheine-binding protein [Wenjunlia tyrosinilytica]GGO97274.1 actinorhodin polyketide synthase acyl carrier protein [Wenjunlia tyrosinilytica]
MNAAITLTELFGVMRRCTGGEHAVELTEDSADISYADLGYDSLALLEIGSQLELRYDMSMAQDAIPRDGTPRQTLDHVNRLRQAAV